MTEKKSKLCYTLPRYEEQDATHFSYLIDFLIELSKDFDIFLIVERGEKPKDNLGCCRISVLKSKFTLGRLLKLFLKLLAARFSGYRDFYIHYSFAAAFSASLIVKIFGGRVFYWNCGEPWKYQRSFSREFFERTAYRLINFLVTGAEILAKQYNQHYKIPLSKIKIMPNWINLSRIDYQKLNSEAEKIRIELGIECGIKILLFVHRLSKRKGAHRLPEILEKLKEEKVFLLVLGDGPDYQAIKQGFEKRNLTQRVKIIGWVPQREILKYFALSDIFLLPSEEEGFPHVLLEALALGVPFVANKVGAVEEITPSVLQKFLVESENSDNFSEKVKELLQKSPEELKEIKTEMLAWVWKFDLSKSLEKFIQIINQ